VISVASKPNHNCFMAISYFSEAAWRLV
jgi:hypothetical protein